MYRPAFERRFGGSTRAWAEETRRLLKDELGFNTMGCFSQEELFQNDDSLRLPYCPRWNFMRNYKNQRRAGPYDIGKHPLPVFDPEWEPFCHLHAQTHVTAQVRDDPWLLGHFSDNELSFHEQNLLPRYLELPEEDAGHRAARRFMAEHQIDSPDQIKKPDNAAFALLVVQEYYRCVHAALKAVDPHHLFLGSRFHGRVTGQFCTWYGAAPYVDVCSVNYYMRWTPEQAKIANWATMHPDHPRPLLVTEWYSKAQDAESQDNIRNKGGAGFYAPTQADRGAFYQHFAMNLLRSRHVVGWHWFRYSDYRDNVGIVNVQYDAYPPLTAAMQDVNRNVYALSDYLIRQPATPISGHETWTQDNLPLFMDDKIIVPNDKKKDDEEGAKGGSEAKHDTR